MTNQQTEMFSGELAEKPVGLRFFLGDIFLFQVNFNMKRVNSHFTELKEHPDDSQVNLSEMPPSVEGVLIRAHPIAQDIPRVQRLGKMIRYAPIQCNHYFVDMQSDFATYLKHFKGSTRQEIQRRLRRFRDFCGDKLTMKTYKTAQDMPEFYQYAREVSKKTYQEKLLRAGLPEGEWVVRDLCRRAEAGAARGYILFHDQRAIAYYSVYIEKDIIKGHIIGYDPEYHKWGPGNALHYMMLEELFNEGGFRIFDYGQGEGLHKQMFSTDSVRCADLYYFRKSLRVDSLIALHCRLERLSRKIGAILQRLGLKARIKKFFRKN